MRKHNFLRSTLCLLLGLVCHVVWAEKIQPSTTLPDEGKPEHVYTMKNGNNVYANGLTAPTQTEANYGQFAFYAVDGVEGAYYIYSHTAEKWLTYTKAASYSNSKDFVKMAATKEADDYFHVENYADDFYQIRPYNTTGVAGKYLNWFQGLDGNPLDGSNTLGLWEQSATADPGSKYSFTEVIVVVRTYTIDILGGANGQTIKIGDETYKDGDTYTIEGSVSKGDITVVAPAGQFATVAIDDVNETITVSFANAVSQPATVAYTNAVLYPAQQTAVGEAIATKDGDAYTLSNNVLAASFIKMGGALYFAGSEAMNLVAGTEPFTVAFGNGDNVPASAMTLESVAFEELTGKADAVGGAEHYDGHALVANYTYTYKESTINIVWRAVLRDGSHYLRTEMELKGVNDVDMFNIIPMIYNVDTKAAGSTPAVVGNTRGAVLMSNKIFAGLETPTAYNTVGGATGEEDKWNLTTTIDPVTVESTAWVQMTEAEANQAKRVEEATGATYPNLYAFKKEGVELVAGQKVEVTLTYKQGSNKLYIGGIDLLASNGDIAAMDYHVGYTGSSHDKNTYTFIVPNSGTYAIRAIVHNKSEAINAKSELTAKIYTPKEGVVINTDIVGIQGRWSRNTTLAAGETWKVAAVVGLIAQDGTQANADIHSTQKRRSFLAYSERERAVPWRAMSMYLAWYELQINRNNADPGREHLDNTKAKDVLDVMAHWKGDFYDRYGISPEIFIVDDGWDKYGEWTFHESFPNEMRDMSVKANEMGAGIGAWLGPVGGYGNSGNHRRDYWSDKGGMQLSNPRYYKAFKDAAYNLVKNQGDNYLFFKFDGISGQFSAVGPDNGDTGNENAEGIIRLEQYVREELREDIFFNTSVGTWASPFWYQITDATWRQENDHDRTGNNSTKRENWITYRDRLVYQNYVQNSPICPINTLMTHGFILTKFGPPASDERDYLPVRNELRAAFLCGSGMVELYNDYDLMNSINGGALWADLAECIAWQKRNADVLPDAHWVGGNPWTGSAAEVYGWAAWNGTKSSLALRNGANDEQTFTFTLRKALNIPANVSGSIILRSAFGDQAALEGLAEGTAIDIDAELTVKLPGSSVYGFEGINSGSQKNVSSITLTAENEATEVMMGNTLVLRAAVNADATFPAIAWTSSDEEVATVVGGLVKPVKAGTVTITATAKDGSGKTASKTITVKARPVVPPFSTEEAPLWHSVEFKTGGHFLTDKGNGNKLVTANAADSDEEYWMFIGYSESFKMKSRLGNYVYYNTENSRFCTTNDASKATELCFVAGKTEGTWELQRVGSTKCMNQNGGTGVGVELGEWTKNDGNNPFYLNEVEIFEHFIEPVFSDENNEHWFMIRFANGNAHLASNGANDQAVTANLRNVSSQWWKFVGTAENFQLVSKDGRYVTVKSGTATNGQTGNLLHMVSEPDANGFSIVESTHASYPGSYEIIWNGASGKSFNQWGGAGAGKSVGVYNVGDNNNPLYIYMPSPDLLSPFDIEGIASYTPASPLTLWYKNAASNMEVSDQWMEYSLPIGNGQFGASIFGGVAREEVQFNEKTLWSGTKNDYATPEYGDYENFGSVYIQDISEVFGEGKPVKDYYRQLDLSNATASVHYKSTDGNINFTREYIASYPDKVVAMHLTASEDAKVSIKVTMAAGRPGLRATTSYADGTATFGGKLETISYNALAKVVPTGGTMTTDEKGITVTGADEVLIILGGATDYDPTNADYVSGTANLPTLVADRVNAAAAKSWSTLYAAHVEDHKSFFDRCDFVLDGAENTMPTDELVRAYANRSTGTESYALMLEQLYFAYGRYLEIGSSRGVDLPSNLQGIWNNSSEPAWNADIHANINVQMNYWPAEPTNLSELHMPFLNYIINMSESAEWKDIATEKAGQSRGWAFLTENNIFGGTGDFMKTAYINNAWYVSHLWQHYRYTLDEEFLERAFPAMWGAAMFWMDRLKLADDGTYVCPNEFSPEHGPTEDGVAHAQQLVWELFSNTLSAVEILGADVNADDLATLKDRFEKLDKGLTIEKYTPNGDTGAWGEGAIAYGSDLLREWKYSNYYAGANGHRHMSHMMCLYPFNQLTAGTDLFNAAINSMKLRGDASTGWSMGWKINLWARALDGDHSHDILELALRHHSVSGGGVYYNLYDSHAPFQIDGNFGACAGIAEMLFQSHTDVLDILPALPSVWEKGSIKGLKAVGNFTVDIEWENSLAQKVTITSHKGTTLRVRSSHGAVEIDEVLITVDGNEVDAVVENGIATIPCEQGQTVVIDFTQTKEPAEFKQKWTESPVAPWNTTALAESEYPANFTTVSGLAVHKAETAVIAPRNTEVTIKFVYSGGSHKLNILGVDLVNADGTVVASDYHHGTTGGSHSNNTYTFANVNAGNYTLRYFVGQGNGDALNKTNGNITVEGLALPGAATNLPKAGKYYRIGYDFGDAGVKYLQSTNSSVKGLAMTAEKGEGSIFLVEEQSNGDLWLKSISTGKYLKETGNTRGLNDAGGSVTFSEGTVDGKIKIAAPSYLHAASSNGNYYVDHCGSDNGNDKAHDFIVEEVKVRTLTVNAPAKVAATATWNGETKALPATWAVFGDLTITNSKLTINTNGTYTFDGLYEGNTSLGKEVTIAEVTANRTLTAKFSPAFFSTTYGEKWVRLSNCSNSSYWATTDGENGKTAVLDYADEKQLWCLVGTAESFVLYNKAAGDTKALNVALTDGATSYAQGNAAKLTADKGTWKLVEKDFGYAFVPTAYANNSSLGFNMWGGGGGDLKLFTTGENNTGSYWVVEMADANNPVTLNIVVDKVWESSPRVAELTFTVNGKASTTRILGEVEGQELYLPAGATYEVSSMTYRGYTYNGCEDVDGVLTASYTANEERTLYYSRRDGHPYRIPAIATAPNGDIFAICDYRPCNMDIGYGEVDLVSRMSSDNGVTWTEEKMIADGKGDAFAEGDTTKIWQVGFGDPAIVADRESNKILVMSVCGNQTCWDGTYGEANPNPNRMARLYITYNEETKKWEYGEPEEVTYDIYRLFENKNGGEAYAASMFIGAGKICQSRVVKKGDYYRLYCAVWNVTKTQRQHHNYVIYSDDFGQTWNVLGDLGYENSASKWGNEPKVEELPDGTVVLSSRKYNGRYFNLFTFADDTYTTGSWMGEVGSNEVTGGLSFGGNSTNGEIYKVKAIHKESGRICDLMFQSIPTGGGRDNVAIYYKEMEYNEDGTNKYTSTTFAQGWTKGIHVSTKGSCYSTMISQADGRIAFFFEEEPSDYCMVYIPYTIEELTDDAYTLYTVNSTIGEYKIGTFYASEAVVIPEGVKAYVATTAPVMNGVDAEGNATGDITMTELEGIIPAHTGAVLRGEAATYKFIPSISYGTAVEGNMLVGFEAADNKADSKKVVTVAEDYTTYVLAVENEKVGFYRKEKGTFNVFNNKAYLDLTEAAQGVRSLTIRFEGDGSTGIENSEFTIQNSEFIYDLMGRRVENPAKGVYIVGGRKVVIK